LADAIEFISNNGKSKLVSTGEVNKDFLEAILLL